MDNPTETRLTALIPAELHRQLKIVLTVQNKSIKQFLVEACEREVGNANTPWLAKKVS